MHYSGSGNSETDKIVRDSCVQIVYFAVLLVLVALIAYYLKPRRRGERMASGEAYYGYPMPNTPQVLTSGADLRFGSQPTGTNEGSIPMNMATCKQMGTCVVGSNERLTGAREPPVFYDISRALGAYQESSQYLCPDGSSPLPAFDPKTKTWFVRCGNGGDYGSAPESSAVDYTDYGDTGREFATASPSSSVQEALLMSQLGY